MPINFYTSAVTAIKIELNYAVNFEVKEVPVPRRGEFGYLPGQDADGYGKKISTDYMIRFRDGGKKWYRVYITQYSNAGTAWIEREGKQYVVRDGEFAYQREQK